MNKKVLLTGITGFLGSHTAIQLLEKGYEVVGTLRNKDRANAMRKIIASHTANIGNLTFVEADLNDRNIWFDLTKNMDYVQHVASPFPRDLPKHEDDLIIPAKQGTLNILQASIANKVKRVVMVSSIAAVVYGKSKSEMTRHFDEHDWTNEANKKDTTPYFRSKTIAEKAAWNYLEKEKSELELTTVLPAAILGPVLEKDFGTSANFVIKILDGSTPALPKIGFDVVDVRSVANLLIKAMELPQAAGKRYIASNGYLSFRDIAQILKQQYPDRKIPNKELPNFAARLLSIFEPSLKPVILELGTKRITENSKAIKELDWQPISPQEAVIACAKSVFEKGIVA